MVEVPFEVIFLLVGAVIGWMAREIIKHCREIARLKEKVFGSKK